MQTNHRAMPVMAQAASHAPRWSLELVVLALVDPERHMDQPTASAAKANSAPTLRDSRKSPRCAPSTGSTFAGGIGVECAHNVAAARATTAAINAATMVVAATAGSLFRSLMPCAETRIIAPPKSVGSNTAATKWLGPPDCSRVASDETRTCPGVILSNE